MTGGEGTDVFRFIHYYEPANIECCFKTLVELTITDFECGIDAWQLNGSALISGGFTEDEYVGMLMDSAVVDDGNLTIASPDLGKAFYPPFSVTFLGHTSVDDIFDDFVWNI